MLKLTRKSSEYTINITADKDEEKRVEFLCRPLSVAENAHIKDMIVFNSDGTMNLNIANKNLYIFRKCVTGWNNITNDMDKRVKFKLGLGGVSHELLDIIPFEVIEEVAQSIERVSKLGETDLKN